MFPFLDEGDVVFFEKVPFAKLKVNDIVVVCQGRHIFTHRVVYKKNNYLITRGDNCIQADGKIYPPQVIGRVSKVKRNGEVFDLKSIYLIQATIYFDEIQRINQIFQQQGINFVFLKGLPLYLHYQKAHPNRIFKDCDILVAEKDFSQAEKTLCSLGYSRAKKKLKLFNKTVKQAEVEYYKRVANLWVVFDIHREPGFISLRTGRLDSLYPSKLLDGLIIKFLKEKQFITRHDQQFPILSPANLIIYLALHFYQHNLRGEFRLEFLGQIIKFETENEAKREILLNEIKRVVRKFKLNNFVYPAFKLLAKYYPESGEKVLEDLILLVEPRSCYKKILDKLINRSNIFDMEEIRGRGVSRLKYHFLLSPLPLRSRIKIFFEPKIIYALLQAGYLLFKIYLGRIILCLARVSKKASTSLVAFFSETSKTMVKCLAILLAV